MEPSAVTGPRSVCRRPDPSETGLGSLQFNDEICQLMRLPQDTGGSFTALLGLPAAQAMELLHSTDPGDSPAIGVTGGEDVEPPLNSFDGMVAFPTDAVLTNCAPSFSVFAGQQNASNSSATSSVPSNSSANAEEEKNVSMETESSLPLISDPTLDNQNQDQTPIKRKEREKKVKNSAKKSKSSANKKNLEDAEKLPYVHVRARRGQATDNHSLAERARREKINARMKLLQELVPGCDKISGTALMLDEIINHVLSLQRQVEFLSMRLSTVNPRIDFNLDSILAAEGRSLMDSNMSGMVMPTTLPVVQINGSRQQYQHQYHLNAVHQPVWEREQDHHKFFAPGSSILSYDSGNSGSLHLSQVKMEL